MNENFKEEIFTATMERTIKRLWILCIILIVLLAGSNAAWIYYESQYIDEETTTVEQQADNTAGGDIVLNGTGTLNYGESKAESDNNQEPETEDGRQ